MAELISGAEDSRQNQELIGQLREVQTLEVEKHQNFIFVLAQKFVEALKTKRWGFPDETDAQGKRRKDESDNELWKIYHTQEFNNPRSPMDIFR
jgi:hypothetical protein